MNRRHLLAATVVLGGCVGLLAVAAPPPAEQARIDKLISYVEAQRGMIFIRNGKEYSCEQAAKFLRGKLESMGKEVVSARDFIDRIATKSSMSGKPYEIRLADGTVVLAGRYLHDELKRIESQPG